MSTEDDRDKSEKNLPAPISEGYTDRNNDKTSASTGVIRNVPFNIEEVARNLSRPLGNMADVDVRGNVFTGNTVEKGDIVAGIKLEVHQHAPDPNRIREIIEQSKKFANESPEYQELVDSLADYIHPRPGRRIIGLENKLRKAGMDSLFEDAKYLKDLCARRIAKHQFSSHKMAVHLYLFGKIHEQFNVSILPHLKQGWTPEEANLHISNLIIKPLADEAAPADPSINADIVRGMLYFLTGQCHLQWS